VKFVIHSSEQFLNSVRLAQNTPDPKGLERSQLVDLAETPAQAAGSKDPDLGIYSAGGACQGRSVHRGHHQVREDKPNLASMLRQETERLGASTGRQDFVTVLPQGSSGDFPKRGFVIYN
jgi:hypothetical protein